MVAIDIHQKYKHIMLHLTISSSDIALSSLWRLCMLDFAQEIPFTHENVSLPLIDVNSSQLLLNDTELMPNLYKQAHLCCP